MCAKYKTKSKINKISKIILLAKITLVLKFNKGFLLIIGFLVFFMGAPFRELFNNIIYIIK